MIANSLLKCGETFRCFWFHRGTHCDPHFRATIAKLKGFWGKYIPAYSETSHKWLIDIFHQLSLHFHQINNSSAKITIITKCCHTRHSVYIWHVSLPLINYFLKNTRQSMQLVLHDKISLVVVCIQKGASFWVVEW